MDSGGIRRCRVTLLRADQEVNLDWIVSNLSRIRAI